MHNVLFLCTGNSARSILGETLINHLGKGRFRGYSAGSHPSGEVHPIAIETLQQHRLPTVELRSKNWHEFGREDSPVMDFVFTVCDNAVAEICPVWPGHPASAHWGITDPAAVDSNIEPRRQAFNTAFRQLEERIKRFVSLDLEFLDPVALSQALDDWACAGYG
jgi:arsenate reductase